MKIDLSKRFENKFTSGFKTTIEPITMGLLGAGALNLGGNILGGFIGADSAKDSAQIQADSADRAMDLYREQYDRAEGYQQPYMQAGQTGLASLLSGIEGGEFRTDVPQYQQQDFNFEADKGYQFRQQQQEQALTRGASARGGVLGGGLLKDLLLHSGGLASQEYGQARGRYERDRQFDYGSMLDQYNMQNQQNQGRYGRLAGLAGMGQNSANVLSNQATNLGGLLGSATMQQGNVLGAGRMGQGNAWQNAIQGITNTAGQMGTGYLMGLGGANPMQGNVNPAGSYQMGGNLLPSGNIA